MQRATSLERRVDAWAHRLLLGAPSSGIRAGLVEFTVFVVKQAWACIFGAALLVVIVAARLWYPDDAALARNDALTIAAVLIQVAMLVFRLESGRELWVIVLFHITGTAMELFKTDVGSWAYAADGFLRIGGVPLYSGFMYAAIGSYMVRVYRLFDLSFTRYPRRWMTAILAVAIYLNFFAHHWWWDARWVLLAGVVLLWLPTVMHARIWRRTIRLPLLAVFGGVAVFIYLAENIGTWAGAWAYPDQAEGWKPVSLSKLSSWFLLMIISVVLVAWVYPPQVPARLLRDSGDGALGVDEVRGHRAGIE
ncbi:MULTISPECIES: DUF817 domain-containing protein [unclassified Microbacterium]|uniref:DUF817 domain-containing protein n=1 Tax=unclassified Microbacterium TaxID=2609290 RepID=UPI000CFBD7E3|nr:MULTISPECIES: DUF817 domain-containing protein [unclassified Microbacterium]PQZ56393.1 hypothetical protein CQ032_09940 [Microbacterium sp. MYb43]PQZ79381.1 hypothetical protein CQ031_09575 [Microbacterium sp. MYb40]PRB19949.1 hypothetical protein CQ040_13765 [Microbacterium sp. MYb54]PRB26939.1 hypothetical protein CQ037_12310 [Microbacterium sp. MYb50]PRB66065.1 hypothetical protein CQ021_12680 [Microbacterium sp. MYb24]